MLRQPQLLAQQSLAGWNRTLRVARSSNLLGRAAMALHDAGLLPDVAAAVRPHLLAALRLVEHQQVSMDRECRRLSDAMARLDSPVLLLKGAAYAALGLRAARGRLYGDIDLLVPRDVLTQAEAALMQHGWIIGDIDPYDDRYYRQWMHEIPPMTHLQRGTVVDLHHNILPLTVRRVPDASLLVADRVQIAGTCLSVLAPVDMVIHSAVHLFHEGELRNGLRDLLDLDALLTQFSGADPSFWSRLGQRTAQLGQASSVHLALRYAARVLETPVPVSVRDEVADLARLGVLHEQWLDALYLRCFLPDHPLASSASVAMARAALYVRSHALRMPLPRLSLHLARKAVMRTVKHSARNAP